MSVLDVNAMNMAIQLKFDENFSIPEVGDVFTVLTWGGDVFDLEMDDDGTCIVLGGEDDTINLYDIRAIGVLQEDVGEKEPSGIIFLRENNFGVNDGSQEVVYAITSDLIETLNVCETYDRYGQDTGEDVAGDYAEMLCDVELFGLKAGDYLSFSESKSVEILDQLKTEAYDIVRNTVTGFNYRDGHNWQTLTVSDDAFNLFQPTHEILDEEESLKYQRIIDIYERCGDCPGVSVLEPKFWGDFHRYRITIF